MSFDCLATTAASLEVHGTPGSSVVPDPNAFVGDPLVRTDSDSECRRLSVSAGYEKAGRGYSLADLVGTRPGG
ncbi:hypothetical protein ONA91_16345 [Micromonospora sp. DR5-3]|uniref:hypothetical protein n=1 Tax=unclassified Micromonospora TaxID=2617518 RepID=UPI0011DA9D3C|nr:MULTISPECIES: hypothetical protein [unclassified Micromonospora]MCW3816013.1 hypothetical protein [Micromonospora sp. DR5-3]TYC20343.1 hypothetical protein FXF52_31835 [Micromonospora sp. MP36]